jgi:hypothetical protein
VKETCRCHFLSIKEKLLHKVKTQIFISEKSNIKEILSFISEYINSIFDNNCSVNRQERHEQNFIGKYLVFNF